MKVTIKNRKKMDMVVLVEKNKNQRGLVFVMHGHGGFKEQEHIQAFAESFTEEEYTVVRFDTTNSYNESEGKHEDGTPTGYYEDLEDVIGWAKKQEWYEEPFYLVGHSLGGMCVALYTENHPEKIKGLAPISTVVSGELSCESPKGKKEIPNWKKTGWEEHPSLTLKGVIKRVPWSYVEDRKKYDLLKNADKLTMPVLMMVGEKDESTPEEHQKILYDKLPGRRELYVIKEAPHTFVDESHLKTIKKVFKHWINQIEPKEGIQK